MFSDVLRDTLDLLHACILRSIQLDHKTLYMIDTPIDNLV